MRVVQMLLVALLALSVTAQQQHVAVPAKSSIDATLDSCVTNPVQPNCTTYSYPTENAAADIGKLCNAMHFMASCSVAKACNASGAGPEDPTGPGAAKVSQNNPNICSPFNQVATVCRLDTGMTRMMGCNNYNSMCAAGSKVPMCSEQTGLGDFPTSEVVNAQVRSICEEMTMDGCELCMPSWQAGKKWADCDLLDVYGLLCYQMPEMGQCSDWHNMCKADASLIFCHGAGGDGGSGGGSTAGPVMKMYFFEEMPFYLLFKQWTPRTNADLAGAWIAIFSLGLLYELLQMLYGKYEAKFWARHSSKAVQQRGAIGDVEYGRPLAEGVENGGVAMAAVMSGAAETPCRNCCGANDTPSDVSQSTHTTQTSTSAKDCCAKIVEPPVPQCCRACKQKAPGWVSSFQPELIMMDVIRGVARFLLAGLAYLLMLAAMSYHVAIFFAVIAGVGVGSMLFGRWRFSSGTAEGYSHCGCGSS